MQTSTTSKFLLPYITIAGLAGCGGGGGAEAPSQPALNLSVPTTEETGLAAPTDNVKHEPHVAVPILNEVLVAYNLAAGAAALKVAGSLAPGLAKTGASPAACAGGGNIAWTNPAAGQFAYSYNACQDSGYTFDGGSTAAADAVGTGWQQSYLGLLTSAVPAPLGGTVSCSTPSAGATRCLVNHGGFNWGYDVRFEAGKAYGTHRIDDRLSWNVTFSEFSATGGGAALVSGANGTALVTHGGSEKQFVVSVTTPGRPTTFYTITCQRAPLACN